jgi:palmitoyltransferase
MGITLMIYKVGNCVTTLRIKSFLALLYIAPTTFFIAVLPILRLMASHIYLALEVSQADPWARRVWWDWFGSWIFLGGPIGRWVVGTILGFRILKADRNEIKGHLPGHVVEQPHLRIIVVAGFGSILCLFAMVTLTLFIHHHQSRYCIQGLAVLITWNVLRGQTSLDTYRPSRRTLNSSKPYDTLVCIPGQESAAPTQTDTSKPNVYQVFPGERLYDLGWFRNVKQVASQPLFCDSLARHRSVDLKYLEFDISNTFL